MYHCTQSKSRNWVPFLGGPGICVIRSIGSTKEHCAGVRTLTGVFSLVLCEQDGSIYTKAYLTCYVLWYKKESQRLVCSWEPPSRFSALTRISRGMSACQSKMDNKELNFRRATILYVLLASRRTRTDGQNGCSQIGKFEWRAFWPLTTKPLALQEGHWNMSPPDLPFNYSLHLAFWPTGCSCSIHERVQVYYFVATDTT